MCSRSLLCKVAVPEEYLSVWYAYATLLIPLNDTGVCASLHCIIAYILILLSFNSMSSLFCFFPNQERTWAPNIWYWWNYLPSFLCCRHKLDVITCGKNVPKVQKAVCSGFFRNAARKDPQEGYKTLVDNQTVYIHPSSALFNRQPDW